MVRLLVCTEDGGAGGIAPVTQHDRRFPDILIASSRLACPPRGTVSRSDEGTSGLALSQLSDGEERLACTRRTHDAMNRVVEIVEVADEIKQLLKAQSTSH